MLRLVLSDGAHELLSVEKEVIHPKNRLLDVLDTIAELIDNLVGNGAQLSNREQRKMGHIRKKTRKIHNKR